MADNDIINQSPKGVDICEDFLIEFLGYNLTTSGVVKKIYVKAPFAKRECNDKRIILDDDKLELISNALNNKFLSSFHSERYSIYDISFRESGSNGSIGLNFIDLKDSTYINPKQAFEPFVNFGIDSISDVANKIENSMFLQCPQYNPISMIGVVFDGKENTCIKSYIRFNQEDAPTCKERGSIIKRIIESINSSTSSLTYFSNIAKKLEDLGFIFYFVGVDCYNSGKERFKLYFRYCGKNNLRTITKEIESILYNFGLQSHVESIFNQHNNGIWGLAVSTKAFNSVNGVQLYLYP